MIIKDIRLTNFGKFHERTIHFERGLNIVYGENEAGKTTIHTFIRGMLFGIDKQRGKASGKDLYSKYEPWDNSENYRGMMRVENNGKTYRFERSFNKNNKSFMVINEDEGYELTETEIEELFQGLDEGCYYNTVSISQMGSVTDRELESILKNYAANLGSTKSMEIDMKQALQSLDLKRKSIIKENRVSEKESIVREMKDFADEIEISEREQQDIIATIEDKRHESAELEEKKMEFAALDTKRLDELSKRNIRVESLYQEIISNSSEADKYNKTLGQIAEQKSTIEKKLDEKGVPTWEKLDQVTGKIATRTNAPIISILFVMCCIGGIIGMMISNSNISTYESEQKIKLLAFIAVAFAGIVVGVIRYFSKRRSKEDILEELKQLKIDLDKLDAVRHEEVYIQRQLKTKQDNLEKAKAALKIEDENVLDEKGYSEELQELEEKERELIEAVSKAQWMIEQKQEKDLENHEHINQLKEQLENILKAEVEIRALEEAKNDIEEIANEVRNSFGKRLNQRASFYMGQITNGKYDNLVIDENLNISVNGKFALIPSSKLSKGTIEQIYMALRLATADIIFEKDKKPILLDDAFAMYDNKRMGNTMNFMSQKLDQVIVFSCHTREKVMADKLRLKYQLIKL